MVFENFEARFEGEVRFIVIGLFMSILLLAVSPASVSCESLVSMGATTFNPCTSPGTGEARRAKMLMRQAEMVEYAAEPIKGRRIALSVVQLREAERLRVRESATN